MPRCSENQTDKSKVYLCVVASPTSPFHPCASTSKQKAAAQEPHFTERNQCDCAFIGESSAVSVSYKNIFQTQIQGCFLLWKKKIKCTKQYNQMIRYLCSLPPTCNNTCCNINFKNKNKKAKQSTFFERKGGGETYHLAHMAKQFS